MINYDNTYNLIIYHNPLIILSERFHAAKTIIYLLVDYKSVTIWPTYYLQSQVFIALIIDQRFLDLVLGAVGSVLRGRHVSEPTAETLPPQRITLFFVFGRGGWEESEDACQDMVKGVNDGCFQKAVVMLRLACAEQAKGGSNCIKVLVAIKRESLAQSRMKLTAMMSSASTRISMISGENW